MASRAQLVDAAKDLNTVLQLNPEIDLKQPVSALQQSILEAADLIREGDTIEASTQAVIKELDGTGAEAETEAPEDEGEGEVVTKPRPARGAAAPAAPAAAAETTSRRGGGFKYEGSGAQKMDLALERGGNINDLAEEAGVKKGLLRAHAKFRAKGGNWTLAEGGEGNEDFIKMTKVEAAAE